MDRLFWNRARRSRFFVERVFADAGLRMRAHGSRLVTPVQLTECARVILARAAALIMVEQTGDGPRYRVVPSRVPAELVVGRAVGR